MPVRIGKPLNVKGLKDYVEDPVYATAVGLLRYGQESTTAVQKDSSKTDVIGLWQKVQSWFKGEF
jgi:cell division protein FtsA